jgi:polyisoprenoid-binding protein YceI
MIGKTLTGLAAGLLLTAAGAAPAFAQAKSFAIDKHHTSLFFMVNHLGYSNVLGLFRDFEGEFTFDDKNPTASKVKLTIKTDSVDTNDQKRADGARSRDEHLRNPDFFNAKEFPTMVFESTKVETSDGKSGKLHGNLTLLGQTKPVVLDVTFNKVAPHPLPAYNKILTVGFSVRGKIKRSDWGMKFAVPALGDEITLMLEVEGAEKK